MAQVINTNIASLNAQRHLNSSQGSLQTSLTRLSSGLRINSAKDDAAGLSISERFSTQIRGINQAMRNANDGISLAQTGEGALQEVTNNLQRIRELAVQSANATNSASDRKALNDEVAQRLAEIDRIASQTSFNGQKILDGTFGDARFQVGANVGETIGLSLDTSMRRSDIGAVAAATSVDLGTVITEEGMDAGTAAVWTTGAVAVNDYSGSPATISITAPGSAQFDVTVNSDITNAGDLATVIQNTAGYGSAGFSVTADGGNLVFTATGTPAVGDFTIAGGTVFAAGTATTTGVAPAPTAAQPLTIAADEFTIALGDGDAVSVSAGTYNSAQELVDAVNSALGGNAQAVLNDDGTMSINASGSITIGGTVGNTTLGFAATTQASGNLMDVNVLDANAADDALRRIDSALTSVSDLRSTFGAIQNRFESTIANLSTTSENLSASRSRIMDTDFAQETANLTRAQILQQAGTAMLAQANSLPQNVLSLLR